MLRPARLTMIAACAAAIVAFTAASASAGTTDITISGCVLRAASTGTPPANVIVSPTTGSCTVSGITGTATTTGNTTLTTQPDSSVTADTIDVTVRATILIFVRVTCRYVASNVNLPLVSAGPPTWTYETASATARKVSGPDEYCGPEVTGAARAAVTP